MKPLIYLFTFLLSISCIAQKKVEVKRDTVVIKEIPAYSKTQVDSMQREYFEILKSTNEQLNNSWTPWNIILGILALLFGGGSIWAGLLIWRQGKEFENKRDEVLQKVKNDADTLKSELKDEVKKNVDEKNQEFEKLLTSTREAMEALVLTEAPEIRRVIIEHIKSQGNWIITGEYSPIRGIQNCLYLCPSTTCHHIWRGVVSEIELRDMTSTIYGGRPPVLRKCPKCGYDFGIGRPRAN